MRAIICTRYGPPDVLQLMDVEKPTPQDNEVLIKIHAATVTPSDCAFRKGEPFIVKLIYGLSKPRLAAQGVELAGEIEAVGPAVRLFKPGDQVFGTSPNKFGAQAEYVCLPANAVLAIKPMNVTYAEAASVCDGATTALTFLRDKAHVRPSQKVLVNGASGSVGAYAIQLAKFFGAEVIGVCSTANVQLVKSLGADRVIDYTQADFTQSGQHYHVVFDAVGKSSFPKCKVVLTPEGIYLSTVPTLGVVWHMMWTSLLGGKKAVFATAGLEQSKDNLDYLRQLVESGAIKPVIDRCYPLEQVPDAHRYVDTGRKKGSVIITVVHGAHG